MNNYNTTSSLTQSEILADLNAQHAIFHKYLDKLVLSHGDMSTIDLLIEVRQLNLYCLNKYAGLISRRGDLEASQLSLVGSTVSRLSKSDMTLWNIHGQLARLVPVYAKAMMNKSLNRVERMIISHNYDLIVRMKEQLLHPVEDLELV